MERTRKIQVRKSQGLKVIIFALVVLSAAQAWFLINNYKEIVTKIPIDLFKAPISYPISELVINLPFGSEGNIAAGNSTGTQSVSGTAPTVTGEGQAEAATETTSSDNQAFELSDVQKKIIVRLMDLIDSDITWGYKTYPDTGYPTDNIWASTDLIAMVLKDLGYDLMELINKDMIDHSEDYPLDIKNRKEPIKYIDFRDTFFQEQFFKRNALELDNEFIPDNQDNVIQWQPGDIVYFQFDPDDPYKDYGGFISSRTNDQGVPLVIMLTKELVKISEVDKLMEYKVVGHFRYPNPYAEK
ncbi:MAG: DUF1287 domain-containing protein [Actinobacteria bacterium]|nr:DUF1287 domain-containing protein [Actinomycetota bacterium]